MDIEKVMAGLIGATASLIGTGVIALINRGKREQRFDALEKNVESVMTEIKGIDKRFDEKVSLALFKEEINELNIRVSLQQKEQAESLSKLADKVDRVSEGVWTIKGSIQNLPEVVRESVKAAMGNT
jgi:hypothetical protein